MNVLRSLCISAAIVSTLFALLAYQADAAGPKVSEYSATGNKHNLSVNAWSGGLYETANPNKYKAASGAEDTNPRRLQICVFCHTPHNANVDDGAPLWNRTYSAQTFSRYSSGSLQIRLKSGTTLSAAGYGSGWAPDGSSKLCLSCHDGVSSLGTLLNGGVIAMAAAGGDTITGNASFNPTNNKMKTGHHPVSFVYNSTLAGTIVTERGIGAGLFTTPTIGAVKLDKNGKMQCTTCHNVHQNQSHDDQCYNIVGNTCDATYTRKKAPFWVYSNSADAATDQQDVCLACHPLDGTAGSGFPYTPNTIW